MNEEIYRDYSIEDFIGDETFINWVQNPDQEQDSFWSGFLEKHPGKKKQVSEAANIIRGLQVIEPAVPQSDLDRVFSRINEKHRNEQRQVYLFAVLKYAAVLIVLVTAGVLLVNLFNYEQKFPLNLTDPQDLKKGRVILPDGTIHEFEEKESFIEHEPAGGLVINSDTVRNIPPGSVPGKSERIRIIVPYGKITRVTLSDGTRVWLNSGSQFAYPEKFRSDRREVYLAGEAFFNVEEDANNPFLVTTGDIKIEVLGTQFNVSSYPDDPTAETVLVDGKVSVTQNRFFRKSFELDPGERLSLNKLDDKILRDMVNVEQYYSWIHEYLVFENAPVTAVFRKLERFYNQNIEYRENELERITFSGKLDLKENLKEVLEIIAYASSISVNEQEGRFVIEP